MRISLPYPFTTAYKKLGKSSPSTNTTVGWITTDIPEPTSEEVEVVAEWHVNAIGNNPRFRATCISYNDELYVEVLDDRTNPTYRLPAFPGDPCHQSSVIYNIVGMGALSEREGILLRSAMEGAAVVSPPLTGVVSSNLDTNRAVVDKCARSLIFYDDVIWKKVDWIGLELAPFVDSYAIGVKTSPTGFDALDPDLNIDMYRGPAHIRRFGLNELERAKSHAVGEPLGFTFTNLKLKGQTPDFDAERDFILRCANFALRKTKDNVGLMSTQQINDWITLRETYAACSSGGDELPEDTCDVIRRFAEAIPDDRARHLMTDAVPMMEAFIAERGPVARSAAGRPTYG